MHRGIEMIILMLFLDLLFLSAPTHAQVAEASSGFEIKFERVIANESWENYVGLSSNGPYFVDESSFVLLDAKRQLKRYYLSGKPPSFLKMPEGSPTFLFKLGDRVFLQTGGKVALYRNGSFWATSGTVDIQGTLRFDFAQGLIEANNSGIKVLIPYEKYVYPFDRTFITLPVANDKKEALFYLSSDALQPASVTHQLIRFDLESRRKKVLLKDTFFFCFIPKNLFYILAYGVYGKFGFIADEHPGDFAILDSNTGAFIQEFDLEDYQKKREFTLASFDINANGQIAALGGYHDFSNIENPKRYFSVLLLSLSAGGKR